MHQRLLSKLVSQDDVEIVGSQTTLLLQTSQSILCPNQHDSRVDAATVWGLSYWKHQDILGTRECFTGGNNHSERNELRNLLN